MPPTPPHQRPSPAGFAEFSLFVAFNFGFEFLLFFTPLPNLPKPPKIAQKTSKNLPKTPPKLLLNRISSCNARNLKKIRPSHTKPLFLMFPGLRKSLQNRDQNAFIIDSLLDALLEPPKIRIWMPKRRQDRPPKFHYFPKNPSKNSNYSSLWSMMPLRSLQEPPKSLPRGSQEAYKPSGSTQEPPGRSRAAK